MDTSFYHISERAVERVAEMAALTVPGVRHLDAQLAGLAGRKYPRVDVHLDRASAIAAVEAEIATTYPSPVAAITDAVRATIIEHIRSFCGLDVSRVKVTVANVEADPHGGRVTWDDVASHTATPEPKAIRISPSRVVSPVTQEPIELSLIDVHSLVDDMRDVTVPAPPHVTHIHTPPAPAVRTTGFTVEPRPLEEISVAPRPEVRVPLAPKPRATDPVVVHPTHVRPVRQPAPAAITPVRVAAPQPLRPVLVENTTRVEPVSMPLRAPLKQVLVEREPLKPVTVEPPMRLRHVEPPAPTPVFRPQAPAPKPLKQIRIEPVEKYYDRTS